MVEAGWDGGVSSVFRFPLGWRDGGDVGWQDVWSMTS